MTTMSRLRVPTTSTTPGVSGAVPAARIRRGRRPRWWPTLSVRSKLYLTVVPTVVLAGTIVLAAVLPYRAMQARLAEARQDVTAVLAAQRLHREMRMMVWHTLLSTVDSDRAHVARATAVMDRAASSLKTWQRNERLERNRRLIEDLERSKRVIDEVALRVLREVGSGDPWTARAVFDNELYPPFDDGFDDDVEYALRPGRRMQLTFLRVARDAGRLEPLFGGRFDVRMSEDSDDVAGAVNGSEFSAEILDGATDLTHDLIEQALDLHEARDDSADAERSLERWRVDVAVQRSDLDEAGDVARLFDFHTQVGERIIALAARGNFGDALELASGPFDESLRALLERTEEVIGEDEADVQAGMAETAKRARNVGLQRVGVTGSVLVVAAGLLFPMARNTSRRLVTLTSAAREIETGLYVRVADDQPDELGELARSFDSMTRSLTRSSERISELLDRTIEATEQERTKLAAEIHDGPIQRLTVFGFGLERVSRRLGGDGMSETKTMVSELQRELSVEVGRLRRLMVELRPPALDERGLAAAVEDYLHDFGVREDVAVSLEASLEARCSALVETTVYRVVQEALTNVAKHARARNVRVTLGIEGGSLVLSVADDGVGFDPDRTNGNGGHDHFGLFGMRQRVVMAGGRFEVRSRPGTGTTVRASLPIDAARVA